GSARFKRSGSSRGFSNPGRVIGVRWINIASLYHRPRPRNDRRAGPWPAGPSAACDTASAGPGGARLEAPVVDVRGHDLDDHGVRLAEGRVGRVLRELGVERLPDAPEARAAPDERRRPLDHHPPEVAPRVGVRVDGDRDPGIGLEVPRLARGPARPEAD